MSDQQDHLPSRSHPGAHSGAHSENLSLRVANASISEDDRAEVRAIEETAYGFRPASEEEMMLAGQLALTNRTAIAAMMRGYLGADRRGDPDAMGMAIKLMTLSLKQLGALNTQRTLRRLNTPAMRSAVKSSASKKPRKR